MALDYTALAATAARLLSENGQTITLRQTGVTSSDPAAGTVTLAAPTDTSVSAVRTRYSELLTPDADLEQGDAFWLLDTVANSEDSLVVGSEVWRIVNTWPIDPAGTFIACRVQVRR